MFLHFPEISAHDGKGFILSKLPGPQGGDGVLIPCVTGKVKPSETFDRYNPPFCQKIQGLPDWISRNFLPISILQAKRGTASRAGIGLGVKPPVPWVLILFPADGAHRERSHGCFVAIVRNVLNDGKSRAAEGAVDEGISVSKISG